MRYVPIFIALLLAVGCAAYADDIVTMPTANQLKAGEVDIAAYYLGLDFPSFMPQHVQYQTAYVGVTDWLEIDAHRADVDKDRDSVVLVASARLLSEGPKRPDLVFGVRNLAGIQTTNANNPATCCDEREMSKKRSYFLSAAKTFFVEPTKPGPPLVRVHLSLGTEDWTLLGEKRHNGLFGGLQMLFQPNLGAVVQHDGQDLITGVTFMPGNMGLTLKAGGYGDHWWVGVAFRKDLW